MSDKNDNTNGKTASASPNPDNVIRKNGQAHAPIAGTFIDPASVKPSDPSEPANPEERK